LIAKEKTARSRGCLFHFRQCGVDLARGRHEKFMETTPSARLRRRRTAAMGAASHPIISAYREGLMLRALKAFAGILGLLGILIVGSGAAEAACQLIKATASADSKANAAKASQALAAQSAAELKQQKGWKYVTMSARTVAGDPFWKAVRPNGVPPEAKLKGNIVTARTFTTCFTGVVVPYVCTSGSAVCGN
jgi:hypothetical protein